MYSFVIPGVAAPQGSKRHVGRGRLIESSARLKPWRELVTQHIIDHLPEGHVTLDGPVELDVTFYLPRPRTAKKRLYPHKGGPGDLDKLVRAIGDAITASGLWKDDAQMVTLTASKRYTHDHLDPRVSVTVRDIVADTNAWYD